MDDENDSGLPAEGTSDQTTPQTMEQVYETHKIEDEAAKYADVLGHNYPEGHWYRQAMGMLR